MKTKTLKQKVNFKASPHDVYELIMDSKKHAEFTNSKVKIIKKIGNKFSAYDGYIEGINLKLVPDKEIVQKWRANHWPQGYFSKATFLLKKSKDGTVLTFTQTGIPAEDYESKRTGWIEHYWEPMKKMLEKK